jgi:hypothetical protein
VNDTGHSTEYRTFVTLLYSNVMSVGTSRDVLSYSRRKEHVNPERS